MRDHESPDVTHCDVTVLLPTTLPWPAIAAALESLLVQVTRARYEILVLDGHGSGLSETHASMPGVRWQVHHGSDVFALRAVGVVEAKGTIIAISEDHCIAAPDWIESIVAAHRGAALAVVGATENHPDSARKAVDRANFLLTFSGQNRQCLNISSRRLPVPTNLSFKRDSLRCGLVAGQLEYQWLAELRQQGAIETASSVILQHRQCWGAEAPSIHLASGRSYGAAIREWSRSARLHWWLALPLMPFKLLRLTIPDALRGAGGAPVSVADLFWLMVLIASNITGQVLGVLAGPGRSREKL